MIESSGLQRLRSGTHFQGRHRSWCRCSDKTKGIQALLAIFPLRGAPRDLHSAHFDFCGAADMIPPSAPSRTGGNDAVAFTSGPQGAPFSVGVVHAWLAADRERPLVATRSEERRVG